jgi:hypothetical protein
LTGPFQLLFERLTLPHGADQSDQGDDADAV